MSKNLEFDKYWKPRIKENLYLYLKSGWEFEDFMNWLKSKFEGQVPEELIEFANKCFKEFKSG